jgi:hypothetical protein
VTSLLAVALAVAPVASAHHSPPYGDGVEHDFGEDVDYWLLFPVDYSDATYTYFYDTFYSPRAGGTIHHATDIMAPKMTPIVASNSGTVKYVNWSRSEVPPEDRCCTMVIDHDDGWESWYIHLNNDTPGTDDGKGWGIAPGIVPGVHVNAGQLIGWVGDSGNAENTGPHLHYELKDPQNVLVNPYEALLAAKDAGPIPRCGGEPVSMFVTVGVPLYGTSGNDVILGTNADDVIYAGDGDDIVCGLDGADFIDGGEGDDTLYGGAQQDKIFGGGGADRILPGKARDVVKSGPGADTIVIEGVRNRIRGGSGNDRVDYSIARGSITVDLATGVASNGDRLFSIELINGAIVK